MSDGQAPTTSHHEGGNVDEGGCVACPICDMTVNPGAGEHCRHYLCIRGEEGFDWLNENVAAFTETIDDLHWGVQDFTSLDDWDDVLDAAPRRIADLITRLAEAETSGPHDLSAVDAAVVVLPWADEYQAVFHPDAPAFALRLRALAEDALAWLETVGEEEDAEDADEEDSDEEGEDAEAPRPAPDGRFAGVLLQPVILSRLQGEFSRHRDAALTLDTFCEDTFAMSYAALVAAYQDQRGPESAAWIAATFASCEVGEIPLRVVAHILSQSYHLPHPYARYDAVLETHFALGQLGADQWERALARHGLRLMRD